MKKFNVFAFIGMVFFNLVIVLGLVIAAYGILFAAWVSVLAFITSPLLIIGAHFIGLQAFAWTQMGLAILLALIGSLILPALISISRLMFDLSKRYLAYNLKVIYSI